MGRHTRALGAPGCMGVQIWAAGRRGDNRTLAGLEPVWEGEAGRPVLRVRHCALGVRGPLRRQRECRPLGRALAGGRGRALGPSLLV